MELHTSLKINYLRRKMNFFEREGLTAKKKRGHSSLFFFIWKYLSLLRSI